MMNTYKYLLAVILAAGTVISCEKWPDRQVFEGSGLGAVTKYYEVQENQTDFHVDVIATMPYEIRNTADWISVPATSQARDGFTISCQPNTGLVRQASIILAIEKTSHYDTVVVRQNGTTAIKMIDAEADGVANIAMNSQVGDHQLSVDYYGNDTEWISDLKVEGNDISFSYQKNELDIPRFASVSMTFKDAAGLSLSHRFDVFQRTAEGAGAAVIDLTEGEKWANCYLLDEPDAVSYSFEPKHVSGKVISDRIRTAEILWETAQNTVGNLAYDHTSNKMFFTKTAGAKGNAVVALKDYNGNILWSCHLWVTSQQVKEISLDGVTFLDRNIGAVASTAPVNDESDAAGTYYQWGRKDPFPAPKDLKVKNATAMISVYPDEAITMMVSQNGVSLEKTIENPSVYYWGDGNKGSQDWSLSPNDGYWSNSQKTDYDPCPYGYVVPSKSQMGALIGRSTKKMSAYGSVLTDDIGEKHYLCWSGWLRRKIHATAPYAQVGEYARYWSADTGEKEETSEDAKDETNKVFKGAYVTNLHEDTSTFEVSPRRWGATIRCVKQAVQPAE